MLAGRRMYDLFEEKSGEDGAGDGRREVNPDLVRLARMENSSAVVRPREAARSRPCARPTGSASGASAVRIWTPSRPEVIDRLDAEGLLPAITFIFSRAGCEAAVQQCLYAGLRLNDDDARATRARPSSRSAPRASPTRTSMCSATSSGWRAWSAGIAAHHAGMLPTFKEVVEELFVRGLVKAVFATETLALGINMPARSVVLEKLVKWNGEQHADITPGEYTQLTGRAGRRGIDVEGHAVVLWQRGMDPAALAGLAGTRTYPLRSSFKPSYNMAVNLVAQFGRHRSRELLETSFAQFQADKSVVGISRQVQRNEEGLQGYRDSMTCHLGDFDEYARLRRELKDRENELAKQGAAQRRAAAAAALEKLKPGDVIHVPTGKFAGLALVLDPGLPAGSGSTATGASTNTTARVRWCSPPSARSSGSPSIDFPVPVEPLDRMRIPEVVQPAQSRSRGGIWRPRCAPRPGHIDARAAPQGAVGGGRRHARSPGCGPLSAPTPATAATSARTTPAGRSATTG